MVQMMKSPSSRTKRKITPSGRLFCCQAGLVGAATQELDTQNCSLLATRLLAVSAVSFLGYLIFFVRGFFIDFSFIWEQTIPLIVLAGCIIVLRLQKQFSIQHLRWLELVVFYTGILYLAFIHYLEVLEKVQQSDVVSTSVAINQLFMCCFGMLFIYGMFIPNTWRRALAVSIPMLLTPVLLSLRALEPVKIK